MHTTAAIAPHFVLLRIAVCLCLFVPHGQLSKQLCHDSKLLAATSASCKCNMQSDHEKHTARAKASESLNSGTSTVAPSSQASCTAYVADSDVAVLYKQHGDLSLKDGQTIRWCPVYQQSCQVHVTPKLNASFKNLNAQLRTVLLLPSILI